MTPSLSLKFKEEKTCEDYRCRVGGKVEEAKWKGLGANDHWQQMKGIMMETAQDLCGMTKGPPRHKETWWSMKLRVQDQEEDQRRPGKRLYVRTVKHVS